MEGRDTTVQAPPWRTLLVRVLTPRTNGLFT